MIRIKIRFFEIIFNIKKKIQNNYFFNFLKFNRNKMEFDENYEVEEDRMDGDDNGEIG